jgi:hypothetical protein
MSVYEPPRSKLEEQWEREDEERAKRLEEDRKRREQHNQEIDRINAELAEEHKARQRRAAEAAAEAARIRKLAEQELDAEEEAQRIAAAAEGLRRERDVRRAVTMTVLDRSTTRCSRWRGPAWRTQRFGSPRARSTASGACC